MIKVSFPLLFALEEEYSRNGGPQSPYHFIKWAEKQIDKLNQVEETYKEYENATVSSHN